MTSLVRPSHENAQQTEPTCNDSAPLATLCNTMELETPELPHIVIAGALYYAATDVARVLGVSRQTLWRWRTDGKVPSGQRFRDGKIVFSESDLVEIRQYATQLSPVGCAAATSEETRHD